MSRLQTVPSPAATSPHGTLIYHRKYPEAIAALRQLGFPRAQQTARAALTLLALLGLTPDLPWRAATDPPCRISTLLAFAARHYDAAMPPHARETVRRRCVRPFLAAGLVVANPDRPDRPVNSPATVYQIAPGGAGATPGVRHAVVGGATRRLSGDRRDARDRARPDVGSERASR